MNADDIRKAISSNVFGFDTENLKDDDDFYKAGLDSLDLQIVLLSLQENHNFVVSDEDIEQCQSISGILKLASGNS